MARIISAVVLGGCLTLLALATWLRPDPRGLGTHRQLGFSPCPMPMITGLPCPTCGMTTAFAHAVRGRFAIAFLAQPAGLLAAFASLLAAGVAVFTLVTGRVIRINWYRVRVDWIVFLGVGCVLAAWVFKIATFNQTAGSGSIP